MQAMMWLRQNGGRVAASAEAWDAWNAAMQGALVSSETGGILLGRRLKDSDDVIIDQVLPADETDNRGFLSFIRGAIHQRSVDRAWRETGGATNYLGDWHTHPQRIPQPSFLDKLTWRRLVSMQRSEHVPLFFFIVGSERVLGWEAGKSLTPMREHLPQAGAD